MPWRFLLKKIIFCKCREYKVYVLHASCWDNFMVIFLLTTVLSIHHLHYWFIFTDSVTNFSRQTQAFLMCVASVAAFWPTLTGSVYKISSIITAHSCILALDTNQAQQASLCLLALSSLVELLFHAYVHGRQASFTFCIPLLNIRLTYSPLTPTQY